MIQNPEMIIEDFNRGLRIVGFERGLEIEHEPQRAPHNPHSLPAGKCAVYVFSLSEEYGRTCSAGPHRALKVGRAGPRSNARFQYQHYTGSAESTLAGSLEKVAYIWPYIGIDSPFQHGAADWIRRNTDRDNFYLEAKANHVLGWVEGYVRGVTGPVFEGVTLSMSIPKPLAGDTR